MEKISKERLSQYINQSDDILLINVLPRSYFHEGEIYGAINIPIKNNNNFVKEVKEKAKSKSKKIVLYCKNTECDLSKKAARKLEDAGFLSVEDYEEGIEGWLIKKTRPRSSEHGDGMDYFKAAKIPDRLKKKEKIVIITDEGVEDLEFFYPYYRFNEEGYKVDVVTEKGGAFKGKNGTGLHESKSIEEVDAKDYVLLYLPGGRAPHSLRENETVLDFVREFARTNRPIASICHGAQILISAGLVKGRRIAAWVKMEEEVEEAGAEFANEALQEEGQFITARMPGDLHRHLYGVLQCLKDSAKSETLKK